MVVLPAVRVDQTDSQARRVKSSARVACRFLDTVPDIPRSAANCERVTVNRVKTCASPVRAVKNLLAGFNRR